MTYELLNARLTKLEKEWARRKEAVEPKFTPGGPDLLSRIEALEAEVARRQKVNES